jgi:hypothetical protein
MAKQNSSGAVSNSPVFSIGSTRRSSASGWITTVVSLRASTISSKYKMAPLRTARATGPSTHTVSPFKIK